VPGPATIADLAEELLQRELAAHPERFAPEPRRSPDGPSRPMLSPEQLALVGGVADAASTYYFLKRGMGAEGNRLLGATNSQPVQTAMGALLGMAGTKVARDLIRKKFPAVADALAANQGAQQLALAVTNIDPSKPASMREYRAAMTRHAPQRPTYPK
jgi:hypothetical protein